MRAVRLRQHGTWEHYAPALPILTLRTVSLQLACEWELPDGTSAPAACLRCEEPSCRRFSLDEVPPMAADVYHEVCPVRALAADDQGLPVFLENCIGCGLCMLRCPFGAIHLGADGRPVVRGDLDGLRLQSPGERPLEPTTMLLAGAMSAGRLLEALLAPVGVGLRNADAAVFYPLVARLMCAIGLPTVDSRGGDTSARMDAIGLYGGAVVPMEVKSFRESPEVNIKAVQQAFENKVIALSSKRGHVHQSDYDAASLAVGYAYPADRSGATTLIQDYATAFDIRIGIVTMRDLYALLVAHARLGVSPDVQGLATLQGTWS